MMRRSGPSLDLRAIAEPSGPRTSLKVNPPLEAALVGVHVPNIRTTDFNSKRQVTLRLRLE